MSNALRGHDLQTGKLYVFVHEDQAYTKQVWSSPTDFQYQKSLGEITAADWFVFLAFVDSFGITNWWGRVLTSTGMVGWLMLGGEDFAECIPS
jgi:hypothetical protein